MGKSSKVEIQTEFTPNPRSLKFNVNQTLLAGGSAFFASKEEAGDSPLARKLFEIPNIENVLIGSNFVTITRNASVDTWAAIISPVSQSLQDYLASAPSVLASKTDAGAKQGSSESEVEKKIKFLLDEYIRPAVARDGGDIVFHSYKNGVVSLHLRGACSHCPSAIATLKSGVERFLQEHIPEVKEVVQVQ